MLALLRRLLLLIPELLILRIRLALHLHAALIGRGVRKRTWNAAFFLGERHCHNGRSGQSDDECFKEQGSNPNHD
ncbi:MAG TPA: hypothetical protein VGG59_15070 [Acidobacteriaceae bacterium]